ncbi:AAA family ATPase [Mesorhizobium sp. M0522]|uniref:AAA family ATPase n=1 Tax=Mesorhizobium sp. M0522 TaxID=2956958 RepID=UPI003338C0D2
MDGHRPAPDDYSSDKPPLKEEPASRRAASGAAQLKTINASNLAATDPPARKFLVPELIPAATVTLFSGDGGTGKSLLALQLGVSTATGTDWIGNMLEEGHALYLSAEDDIDEIHRRLVAICAGRDFSVADLRKLTIAPLAGLDAVLASPMTKGNAIRATALFDALAAKACALMSALIVLDTSADLYAGNENDRAQVRQFVGMLRGLAMTTRAAVVLLSHPSVAGMTAGSGTSGSTAWNNSVRSRLYLERVKADDGMEPDVDLRRLRSMKANYGPIGGDILLRWKSGRFVPEHGAGGIDRISAEARAEAVFLKILSTYASQDRNVSASPGPTNAPSIFASDADAAGFSKAALKKAMDRLLKKGEIDNVVFGSPSHQRSRLALKLEPFREVFS